MSNTEVKRGRGRPKGAKAQKLEAQLREKGQASIRFHPEGTNAHTYMGAYMALRNAGRAVGVPVTIRRAGVGATLRLVAQPQPQTEE